jgi:micrococcal nuclease
MDERPLHTYCYLSQVKRVIDGDTVVLDIDLGCEIWLRNEACRLTGIDTPEVRGPERPEGLIAKRWVEGKVAQYGTDCLIRTSKDKKGKYGRWLVEIWLGNSTESLNELLVQKGLAERIKL